MPRKVISDNEFITLVQRLNHIGFLVDARREAWKKQNEMLDKIFLGGN